MAFQIGEFMDARPFLYHLTGNGNLALIRASRDLVPAVDLLRRAGRVDLLRQKRVSHEVIEVTGQKVSIRDQKPLHRGNIELANGYTYEKFIESLNSRIFFWPGTHAGPIAYGVRHFERYENERPAILRVQFQSLVEANPRAKPLFCKYNSGSPRCSNGKKSPRGPETFVCEIEFVGTASNVVEVTFSGRISLPPDTEFGYRPTGPWQALA